MTNKEKFNIIYKHFAKPIYDLAMTYENSVLTIDNKAAANNGQELNVAISILAAVNIVANIPSIKYGFFSFGCLSKNSFISSMFSPSQTLILITSNLFAY